LVAFPTICWLCTNFLAKPSARLPTCLFIYLSIYLFVYLSIYLFIYLYLPAYTYLYIPIIYTYLPIPTYLYVLSIPTIYTYLSMLSIYTYLFIPTVYTSCLCYCLYLPIYNLGERLARLNAPPNLNCSLQLFASYTFKQ